MANTIPKVYSKYLYDIDVNDIKFKHSLTVSGDLNIGGTLTIDNISSDIISTDNISAKYLQTDNKTFYSKFLNGSENNNSVIRISIDRLDGSSNHLNGAFNMLFQLHNPDMGDIGIDFHGILDENQTSGFQSQSYSIIQTSPNYDLSSATFYMTASGNVFGYDCEGKGYYFLKFTGAKPFHLSTVSIHHVTPPSTNENSQLNMKDYISVDLITDASYNSIASDLISLTTPLQNITKNDYYLDSVDIKNISSVDTATITNANVDTLTLSNTTNSYILHKDATVERIVDNGETGLTNVKMYETQTFDILTDAVFTQTGYSKVFFKVKVDDFTSGSDYKFNLNVSIISLQYGKLDINFYTSNNDSANYIYYYYDCNEQNMKVDNIKYRDIIISGEYYVYFCVELVSSENKNYSSIKSNLVSDMSYSFELVGNDVSVDVGHDEYTTILEAFTDPSVNTAAHPTSSGQYGDLKDANIRPLITKSIVADNVDGATGGTENADGVSATSLYYILDMCRVNEQSLGSILNRYSLNNIENLETQIVNCMNIYIHTYGLGLTHLPHTQIDQYYHMLNTAEGTTSGSVDTYLSDISGGISSTTIGKINDFFIRYFDSIQITDSNENPITNQSWYSTNGDTVSNFVGLINFNLLGNSGLGLYDYNGDALTSIFEFPKENIITNINDFIKIDTIPSKV